jgi:hypothetical protein
MSSGAVSSLLGYEDGEKIPFSELLYIIQSVYHNPIIDHINIYNEKQYQLTISVTEITGQQIIYLNNTRDQLTTLPAGTLSRGSVYCISPTCKPEK